MEQLRNVETNGSKTSAVFLTDDFSKANMLRRAIYNEIDTYAIEFVIFDVNTSAREDEILALRMGQCVIDHTRFVPPEERNYRYHIDFAGPGVFTTEHIVGIPFTYVTPIAELLAGQRILCDVIVRQGRGAHHAKWSPVSTVNPIKEVEGGYLIELISVGMMPGIEVLERGIAGIPDAIKRPARNIFFQPLTPYGAQ
jgi:DNA-directed RNA polymerase alpha subunit